MKINKTSLVLALLLLTPGALFGATVVHDVLPGPAEASLVDASGIVFLDGRIYFQGTSPLTGDELFTSDGTEAGTGPVADLCPGRCSSSVRLLSAVGGKLFFDACNDVRGCGLWTSDGTEEGTSFLSGFGSDALRSFRVRSIDDWNGRAVVVRDDGVWLSDGTADGTVRLPFADPDVRLSLPTVVALPDKVLFFEHEDVRVSDGTSVELLLRLGDDTFRFDARAVGGRVFFLAGSQLWVSDGTQEGTLAIADADPADILFDDGERVFFQVGDLEKQLWLSDGTPAGTRPVAGVPLAESFSTAAWRGGRLYFLSRATQSDFTSAQLWRIVPGRRRASLAAGTVDAGLDIVATANGPLFFTLSDEGRLFRSYGNDAPVEIWSRGSQFREIVPAAQSLVLSVGERFPSGVPVGPGIVAVASRWGGRDLRLQTSPPSADPAGLLVDGERLLFGTVDGGGLLEDGTLTLFDEAPLRPAVAGGHTFFYDARYAKPGGLWHLDDDGGLTRLVPADDLVVLGGSLTAFDGRVFFLARPPSPGPSHELWVSDGTPEGTVLVKADLPGIAYAGPADGTSGPTLADLEVLGDELVMAVEEWVWKSDGTDGGTVSVAERAHPNSPPAIISPFLPAAGGLFFFGDGGLQFYDGNGELREVGDASASSNDVAVLGDRLVFPSFSREDPQQRLGSELWAGGLDGTELLADIRPGLLSSRPSGLTVYSGEVYFSADDGEHGRELWATDGTAAGTRMIADLRPGPEPSGPQSLAVAGGRLFFAADNGEDGLEPWVIDSPGAMPRMLDDVEPGLRGSSPRNFVLFNGHVTFNAGNSVVGFELWQE